MPHIYKINIQVQRVGARAYTNKHITYHSTPNLDFKVKSLTLVVYIDMHGSLVEFYDENLIVFLLLSLYECHI